MASQSIDCRSQSLPLEAIVHLRLSGNTQESDEPKSIDPSFAGVVAWLGVVLGVCTAC